jgi:hypothetical protein
MDGSFRGPGLVRPHRPRPGFYHKPSSDGTRGRRHAARADSGRRQQSAPSRRCAHFAVHSTEYSVRNAREFALSAEHPVHSTQYSVLRTHHSPLSTLHSPLSTLHSPLIPATPSDLELLSLRRRRSGACENGERAGARPPGRRVCLLRASHPALLAAYRTQKGCKKNLPQEMRGSDSCHRRNLAIGSGVYLYRGSH